VQFQGVADAHYTYNNIQDNSKYVRMLSTL
jgi:hypothetical protein